MEGDGWDVAAFHQRNRAAWGEGSNLTHTHTHACSAHLWLHKCLAEGLAPSSGSSYGNNHSSPQQYCCNIILDDALKRAEGVSYAAAASHAPTPAQAASKHSGIWKERPWSSEPAITHWHSVYSECNEQEEMSMARRWWRLSKSNVIRYLCSH